MSDLVGFLPDRVAAHMVSGFLFSLFFFKLTDFKNNC